MRRLLLVLCFALLPCWAASAASSIVATSWPTGPYSLTDGASITVPCPGQADANGVGVSGVYYLTLTGNNHNILFPSCPATSNGQTTRFRINSGSNAGSPFTGLTFAAGFNWTGAAPYASCTAVSVPNPACPAAQVVSQIDEFGCDIIGTTASSTEWDCWTPQYAIAAPPRWVAGALGTFVTSGTTSTNTLAATPGQSVLCLALWGPQSTVSLSSVSDGTSNLTLGDTGTAGSARAQVAYEINISGHSVSTLTATYSGSVTSGARLVCDTISGATSIVTGGHALNPQGNPGSTTDAVTSGSISSAVNALVWGASYTTSGTVTVAAGTGFTQHEQDTSGAAFNVTTETKISTGTTDAATFTNNSATATNNFTGALIVH